MVIYILESLSNYWLQSGMIFKKLPSFVLDIVGCGSNCEITDTYIEEEGEVEEDVNLHNEELVWALWVGARRTYKDWLDSKLLCFEGLNGNISNQAEWQ